MRHADALGVLRLQEVHPGLRHVELQLLRPLRVHAEGDGAHVEARPVVLRVAVVRRDAVRHAGAVGRRQAAKLRLDVLSAHAADPDGGLGVGLLRLDAGHRLAARQAHPLHLDAALRLKGVEQRLGQRLLHRRVGVDDLGRPRPACHNSQHRARKDERALSRPHERTLLDKNSVCQPFFHGEPNLKQAPHSNYLIT